MSTNDTPLLAAGLFILAQNEANDFSAIYIKDGNDIEVLSNFPKNSLLTTEGILLYFLSWDSATDKEKIWLYEPGHEHLLVSIQVTNEERIKKEFVLDKDDGLLEQEVDKITISRVSHDNQDSVPILYLYKYKKQVLELASASGKWGLKLDGINREHKLKQESTTKWVQSREEEKLKEIYPMADIKAVVTYDNQSYLTTGTLDILISNIDSLEKKYMYTYLTENKARLPLGRDLRSVSSQDICNHIRNTQTDKSFYYTKDCWLKMVGGRNFFDLQHINKILSLAQHKYAQCQKENKQDLLKSYQSRISCTLRTSGELELLDGILEINLAKWILQQDANKNTPKSKYHYKESSRHIKDGRLGLAIAFHNENELSKKDHYGLLESHAGATLAKQYFNKQVAIQSIYDKNSQKFGFYINEQDFRNSICNREYTKQSWFWMFDNESSACVKKDYKNKYSQQEMQTYINTRLYKKHPILQFTNRATFSNGIYEFDYLGIQ